MNFQKLFEISTVTEEPKRVIELERICKVILVNQSVYEAVEKFVSVPWPVIACIHSRESSLNFTRHLHNGDPLTGKTVRVPKGRPEEGSPPFTWIESATDALLDTWRPGAWTVPGWLEFLERYNGLGYRKYSVLSPYLWSYTNFYTGGLFVSDGHFEPGRIDRAPGCVALVKTLATKGVSLDFTGIDSMDSSLH